MSYESFLILTSLCHDKNIPDCSGHDVIWMGIDRPNPAVSVCV